MLFESTPYSIIAQRFRPGDALNVEMNGGEGGEWERIERKRMQK